MSSDLNSEPSAEGLLLLTTFCLSGSWNLRIIRKMFVALAAYTHPSALITKIFPSAQDVQFLRW